MSVDLVRLNKGPIPNFSFLGSLEVFFETIAGDGRTRADANADDGNSDNKAISVQLGWDLTELGSILKHKDIASRLTMYDCITLDLV